MIDELTILDWTLAGSLFLLFLLQVYWYSRYLAAPTRKMRKSEREKDQLVIDPKKELPGVSVVLCAHNEGYNLSHYLQVLLTQDYPTYEVIVVDDGSQDNTHDVIELYKNRSQRLHTTFVPADARVRSTKKLALTLAAKSAQYDYLLLTDADCVPESDQWIREMMHCFGLSAGNQGWTIEGQKAGEGQPAPKDIVLGFGAYFYQRGYVNRLVRFDTLFNGLHYLGAALCRHPYMGVGRNLAYRKSLFFQSGGFTRLMDSRAGDDDLFINHVATPTNTAVALNRNSYTWSLSKTTIRDWVQQKRRHLSVSPMYKASTKWRLLFEPLTRGLFYALVIAIAVCCFLPDVNAQLTNVDWQIAEWDIQFPLLLLATIVMFLLRWMLQVAILNTSARRMGLHTFSMFSVLWFDLTLPLVNLWLLIIPSRNNNNW